MQASLQLIITGLPDQDYAQVSATVIWRSESGEYRMHRIYDEKRLAQDLGETMAIEPWALASIAEHTDAIKAAIAGQINKGSKTLISEAPIL